MNNPYTESLKPLWLNKDRLHVFVDEEKLEKLAQKLRGEELIVPKWDTPNVQPPMDCSLEEWLNYVCWVNTVNFSFTNFDPPYKKFAVIDAGGELREGAFALGASFIRAYKEGFPIFDVRKISEITSGEVANIFRSIDNQHKIPMPEERWNCLRYVSWKLLEKYNGSWLNLFEQSNWLAFNNGKGIIERLVDDFPGFYDTRGYNVNRLQFHKRAQLLVMMYHDRAMHSGGKFLLIKDHERLGPPCDYDVPRAIESLGILKYSKGLKKKVENHNILPMNSREEIEIRTATWYVMERLREILNTWIGPVDFKIWNIGRQAQGPHHLTPTIAY